jgi:hypothetical protein
VEFVMRHQAVILAAALAWLTGIESAEARLDILVDKATQRMLVIQNGYMRFIWPVSTGRDETATPSGVYTPQRLERNWFSTAYYNSPMPYSIFFHKGYAIHGSYAINRLGGPASHGCVRLHPHHASLLFDLVQEEGADKTTIEVTGEARPDEPPLPEREIAAGRGVYPPVPEREIAAGRGVYPPVPEREIAAGRGSYPPLPSVRLRRDEDRTRPCRSVRSRPDEARTRPCRRSYVTGNPVRCLSYPRHGAAIGRLRRRMPGRRGRHRRNRRRRRLVVAC